jgi:hypothetical protein
MSGERLDLTTPDAPRRNGVAAQDKCRFLGVHFACCDAYARIYPNRDATAYVGHCPRCTQRIEFKIGPGGVDARFFVVQ